MSAITCAECAYLRGEGAFADYPHRIVGPFVVHAKLDKAAVAGWLVIAPRRHIEALTELNDEETALLGPLIKRCAVALSSVTPTAKVYTASFNEALPHVHFHVIARPPDFSTVGPRIFTSEMASSPAELKATAERALLELTR